MTNFIYVPRGKSTSDSTKCGTSFDSEPFITKKRVPNIFRDIIYGLFYVKSSSDIGQAAL